VNGAEADIAIVGMSALFPRAPTLEDFWDNLLDEIDGIGEPLDEWGAELAYDPETGSEDRTYCKRGGFLNDLTEFDAPRYGVMPRSVEGAEPDHFLTLRLVHEALEDAGYGDRDFDRRRTAVILGRGEYFNRGNVTALQHGLIVEQTLRVLRALHPEHTEDELAAIREELKQSLPPFNAETAPGLVPNIVCGRVANRLDLMGPNYTIDAACASSLIAVDAAVRELRSGRCHLAIAGGVHASTPPIIFMVLCHIGAQ
jgi:acyl transferase domain-containing protein